MPTRSKHQAKNHKDRRKLAAAWSQESGRQVRTAFAAAAAAVISAGIGRAPGRSA